MIIIDTPQFGFFSRQHPFEKIGSVEIPDG
jgi:hypothetical protein